MNNSALNPEQKKNEREKYRRARNFNEDLVGNKEFFFFQFSVVVQTY